MHDPQSPLVERRIYAALILQVYNRAGIAILATAVNASVLTFFLWGFVSDFNLTIWLTLTLTIAAARLMLIIRFRRIADTIQNFETWGRRLAGEAGVSGILWGATAIFLFPVDSTAHQVFIAFVLAGMVAGAVGVFSAVMSAFLAFSIPALLPIAIRFTLLGNPLHLAMAFMTVLFACLTFSTAMSINRSTAELVALRETFADRLVQRTEELQRLNDQFRLEIGERRKTEATLKELDAQIRQSLKEKTMLLQEIHHRVKNNMQVIISLMNLQASQIEDEGLKLNFKEAGSRVNAMSLIHNILYESGSISKIYLSDYFKRLTDSLVRMYDADDIQITIEADGCHLSMDQAIPCGLIINELISNSLKHAFPGRTGQIRIKAHPCDPDYCLLIVQDNGVGLPKHIDLHQAKTLGLRLVNGLAVQQLGGCIDIDRSDQGAAYRLRFKCRP